MITSHDRSSVLLLALVSACAADPAPPAAAPEPPPPPPPATTHIEAPSPPAEDVSAMAYAYGPIGKRDPFRGLHVDVVPPEARAALQRYNLDELKLIAVVTGTPVPYAMIEDPRGKGHVVRRGALVGKSFGRIVSITTDTVVVREAYTSYTGARVHNDVTFTIKPPRVDLEEG